MKMPASPVAIAPTNIPSTQPLNPYAFVAVMVFVTLLPYAGGNAWQWMSNPERYWDTYSLYWQGTLHRLFGSWLLHATIIVLLVHHVTEHSPGARTRQRRLLASFAALYLIMMLVIDWAIRYLSQEFYLWALNQPGGGQWLWLHREISQWVMVVFACGLPLWLLLHRTRNHSQPGLETARVTFANWQIGLSVGLVFALLLFKLGTALVWYRNPWAFAQASTSLYLFSGCVIPVAIILIAVGSRLPQRVTHFATGRIVVSAVVLMLLWQLALILTWTLLMRLSSDMRLSHAQAAFLPLPWSVVMLALLWPFSRLCARWFLTPAQEQRLP